MSEAASLTAASTAGLHSPDSGGAGLGALRLVIAAGVANEFSSSKENFHCHCGSGFVATTAMIITRAAVIIQRQITEQLRESAVS